jgi:hypothetical protein
MSIGNGTAIPTTTLIFSLQVTNLQRLGNTAVFLRENTLIAHLARSLQISVEGIINLSLLKKAMIRVQSLKSKSICHLLVWRS